MQEADGWVHDDEGDVFRAALVGDLADDARTNSLGNALSHRRRVAWPDVDGDDAPGVVAIGHCPIPSGGARATIKD
jgi:hypothetical protein